jgi:hypothetical protein
MKVEVLQRPSELAGTGAVPHAHHLLERWAECTQKQLVISGVAGKRVCSVRNSVGTWVSASHEHTLHGRSSGRRDGGVGSTALTSGYRRVDYADVICERHVGVQHDMRSAPADPVGQDLGVRQNITLIDPLLSNNN